MPRRSEWLLIVVIAAGWLCAPVQAIVVLKKGATKPVMGYLVREDASSVSLREPLKEGGFREHTIPRGEIDELVVTVDAKRLATLDPARPQMYREYAEELAEKQRDPEARDAAVRLFHMAAWLEEGKPRHSALLGLIALARTPDEQRRLRAAAYLLDPEHDREVLQSAGDVALTQPTATARQPLVELLNGLRLLRRGLAGEAKAIFERPASQEGLASLTKMVSQEELLAACTPRPISDEQLAKVLRAEIALERALSEPTAATPEDIASRQTSWSQAVRAGGTAPLPTLDLLTLTEFDPRACVFRSGKWVVP